MKRRDFLRTAAVASAGLVLPQRGRRFSWDTTPDGWRNFAVTTRVEVLAPSGTTRIWVPAALVGETPYQKTLANTFDAPGGTARMVERAADSLGIIAAEFPAAVRPLLTGTRPVRTRDHSVGFAAPRPARQQ